METTIFDQAMRVEHAVEDVAGTATHVVRIFEPTSRCEYKIGRWPVTEKNTSLDAIWSGYFEAVDYSACFDAKSIAVYSTDKEAFAAYCAEVSADE